ncbi:hypothetical protein BH11PSE3_BH11PSE3_27630 [soil metagenome]
MISRVATLSRAMALLAPFLLAACGHSPETQFLTLDPVPGASASQAWRGPPVRIPSVAIPPALDRVEFTRQTAPGEMKVDDLVHWSAPLGMLARNTLILDLAQRLPAGAVAPPDAPAQPGGLRITVSIVSFGVTGGEASMEAAYEITSDEAAAATGPRQWAQLRAASAGTTAVDTARVFSTLLGSLADRIAGDIAGRAGRR